MFEVKLLSISYYLLTSANPEWGKLLGVLVAFVLYPDAALRLLKPRQLN